MGTGHLEELQGPVLEQSEQQSKQLGTGLGLKVNMYTCGHADEINEGEGINCVTEEIQICVELSPAPQGLATPTFDWGLDSKADFQRTEYERGKMVALQRINLATRPQPRDQR